MLCAAVLLSRPFLRSRYWDRDFGTEVLRPRPRPWHQGLKTESWAEWTRVHSSLETLFLRSQHCKYVWFGIVRKYVNGKCGPRTGTSWQHYKSPSHCRAVLNIWFLFWVFILKKNTATRWKYGNHCTEVLRPRSRPWHWDIETTTETWAKQTRVHSSLETLVLRS